MGFGSAGFRVIRVEVLAQRALGLGLRFVTPCYIEAQPHLELSKLEIRTATCYAKPQAACWLRESTFQGREGWGLQHLDAAIV